MRDLVERVLPAYQDDDPDRYFSNLAALQMAVGDPAAARTSRLTLQERLQSQQSSLPAGRAVVYDIYVQARAIEATEGVAFASAYEQAFRETLNRLDDLQAYELEDWFMAPIEPLRETLQYALDQRRETSSITLEEAVELTRAWFAFDAYSSVDGLARPLLAEDEERRYVVEEVAIPVGERRYDRGGIGPSARRHRCRLAADAARVHARSIEPRRARGRGPRLRQRARAVANRGRPEFSAARAVRIRRRRRACRHRLDREAAVERRPCRHAGDALRRLRRMVGSEAAAACAESDRDLRPDGARHRRAELQQNLPELRLSLGL